jgi:DegV family protein with EDD domain
MTMTFKTIRLIADSTCDLPPEYIRQYQIGVVPAYVNYGGKSYADDGLELDRQLYYEQMPGMTSQPTTSAPPPAVAEKIIKQVFAEADHIVMLTAPAALSGIHNAFRLGAIDLPQDRVTLLDSGTLSMGLGFQVLAGAEAAASGDVAAVLEAIRQVQQRIKVYAVPETMEYLRRSGRVGWTAASAAALLQIKPIVNAEGGAIQSVARVRTFGKAIEKLVELVRAEAPLEKLTLLHTNNMEGVDRMKSLLADVLPSQLFIVNATPVIGTHIGPKALGVATLRQSRRS